MQAALEGSTRLRMVEGPGMYWENDAKRLGLVCLVGLLAACSPSTLAPAPQGQAPATAVPVPGQPGSSLTADQINNMDVKLVSDDRHPTVKLTNGEYHAGTAGSADYADVKVVPNFMAFGDLNGDGQGDAA